MTKVSFVPFIWAVISQQPGVGNFIDEMMKSCPGLGFSFQQLDPSIEEAAISLGATSSYTIRRVVLPLVLPGAIAGGLLAFITTLGEFVSSIMVYVYSNRPIAIEILSQLRQNNLGTASAYGVLLIALIFVTLLIGERLRGPLKDPLVQ